MGTAFIFGPLIVGVLLLVGWSVYRLFSMAIVERTLSIGEFLLILSVILVLIAVCFTMAATTDDPYAAVGPLLLLAVVSGFIPLLPKVSNTVRGYQMVRDDIRRYQEALKRQPDVPFPHLKLGDIYKQREDWDRAIEHYQAYVEAHEQAADAKRSLERCLERKRIRDMGLRRCPICGAENPRGNTRCEECGFYLKGSAEIMSTLVTPDLMRLWKWLIVVFLVPGLIVGLLADIIPPVVSIAMLSVSVIATFLFLYGRMTQEGG
jgi:hypothetical protein